MDEMARACLCRLFGCATMGRDSTTDSRHNPVVAGPLLDRF